MRLSLLIDFLDSHVNSFINFRIVTEPSAIVQQPFENVQHFTQCKPTVRP